MPLAYMLTEPVSALGEVLEPDEYQISALYVTGARYGGAWILNATVDPSREDAEIIGTIETSPDERPKMAVNTAYAWISDTCRQQGLKIVHFTNLSGTYPEDARPFFVAVCFLVVGEDWR